MREMIGYIFGNLENIDETLKTIKKSMLQMNRTNRHILALSIVSLGIGVIQEKRIKELKGELTNLRKKFDNIHTEFKE